MWWERGKNKRPQLPGKRKDARTMAERKNPPKITFQLDEELDTLLDEKIRSQRGLKKSSFIREAITEKLESGNADPETESLMNLFSTLNDEGKRWLIQCANIAAGNNATRIIHERAKKAQ